MNILKYIILLLFSSLLFAQETLSLLEISSSSPQSLDSIKKPLFNSFDNALKIAKEEHKIILVELVSTNCLFCDKMEKEVLSKERVNEAINKDFVFAKVNIDVDEIPLGLSPQMTPMFVFATADKNVEDIRLGFMEEEIFLTLLTEERKKINSLWK